MGDAERPIALVTGGGRRVGAYIADGLHATHDLIVHARDAHPDAAAFVEGLNQRRSRSARLLTADLDSATELEQLAFEVGPRLDVLVHNASRFEPCDDVFDDTWADSLDAHMRTNVSGPVMLTHVLRNALSLASRSRRAPSVVAWILDTRRDGVFPGYSSYSISRAAGEAAVQTLAHALAPDVRVIGIAPGTILASARPRKAIGVDVQQRQALTTAFGTPADVVAAIQFALAAPFLNATVIDVNGGKSRWQTPGP